MSLAFHSINGYYNNQPSSHGLEMFWCDFGHASLITGVGERGHVNIPDTYAFRNVQEIPIMYSGVFDPGNTAWLDAAGVSAAHSWGISVGLSVPEGTAYSGYICLDWESNFLTNLRWGDGSSDDPSAGACALQAGKLLLDTVKDALPNALVGYYAIPVGLYWQALASDPVGGGASPVPQSYAEWQIQNDYMKQLTDHGDVLFPSIYNNYVITDEHPVPYVGFPQGASTFWPTYPGGITSLVGWTSGVLTNYDINSLTANTIGITGITRSPLEPHRHWERYQARVNEALRMSDGKPVIAFVWDRLHTNTDPYGGMKQPQNGKYNKAMVHYGIREAKYSFIDPSGNNVTYRPTGYVVWDADPFYSILGNVTFPNSYDPEVFASWTEPNAKMRYQIIHERGATAWNLEPVEGTAAHYTRQGIESLRKFRES